MFLFVPLPRGLSAVGVVGVAPRSLFSSLEPSVVCVVVLFVGWKPPNQGVRSYCGAAKSWQRVLTGSW